MSNELSIQQLIPPSKVIEPVRERYYEGQKGISSLSALFKHLSSTTTSKLFDVMLENLQRVNISCSLLTAASDDAGETYFSLSEDGIIQAVDEVELPKMRRFSMMFYPYIFEATKLSYYRARIGMKLSKNDNLLVRPYFVMLYAIEHSKELFDIKVVNAVKSLYITNLYSALSDGIASTRDGAKFLLGAATGIDPTELNPVIDVTGILKAVAIYETAKKNENFDSILNAVLDNSKDIGQEFAYDVPELDIRSDNVLTCARNFIKENVDCLRNIDEPDEYIPPTINFED